jgi:hypothetical protein
MGICPPWQEFAMTKRQMVFTLAVVTPMGLALLALICFQPVRFTKEMADRIHTGMTEAEVIAVLGRPAGDYHNTAIYLNAPDDYRSDVWVSPGGVRRADGTTEKAWISNAGGVAVEFDLEGRVSRTCWEGYWTHGPHHTYSLVVRILRRLLS